MNAVVYESRMDRWVVAISLIVMAAGLAAAILLAELPGPAKWVLLCALLLLTIALPASLLLNTCYTLSDEALRVQSGPFRWDIRLAEISVIEAAHRPRNARLQETVRVRVAHTDGVLLISPYEAYLFMQDLQARCERCRPAQSAWRETLHLA